MDGTNYRIVFLYNSWRNILFNIFYNKYNLPYRITMCTNLFMERYKQTKDYTYYTKNAASIKGEEKFEKVQ